MKGRAEPDDMLMLRDVFGPNRKTDSIRLIRQRVERYESFTEAEAERQARAKLNARRPSNSGTKPSRSKTTMSFHSQEVTVPIQ